MQYRREIDGLRAVAVVPVILFHAGFDWASGGYVGVDVFFVISGYLITTILLDELRDGRFSIARFYERRARRILPALFFVLACTSVAAAFILLPSQLREYSRALVAVTLFVSNVFFWRETDYFAPAAELNPLLHTWSLAVEEQFYIFFPLLLLVLWRFGFGRAFGVVVALSLLSLGLAEWGWRNAPVANFFLIPTRAWELGAGAICAFVLQKRPPRADVALSTLGLALVVGSVFVYGADTPFPSVYALAPVGGAALVILYGAAGTPVARLLGTPALVGIGLVSYSAYLWHQPLFAFARALNLAEPPPVAMAALSVASVALGYLSWRFVEQPFRRRPAPALPTRRGVFVASSVVGALTIGLGGYGVASDGRLRAWQAAHPERVRLYAMIEAAASIRDLRPDDGACRFSVPTIDADVADRLVACAERYGPGMTVIGDSHAVGVYYGLHELLDVPFLVGVITPGCRPAQPAPPYTNGCPYVPVAEFAEAHPRALSPVLFVQSGHDLLEQPDGRMPNDAFEALPEYAPVPVADYRVRDAALETVADYLGGLARTAEVIWLGPRIEPYIGVDYLLSGGCDFDYRLRDGIRDVFALVDRAAGEVAANRGLTYVSEIDAVDLDPAEDLLTCDTVYWRDTDHWSPEGAVRFMGRLLDGPLAPLRVQAHAKMQVAR